MSDQPLPVTLSDRSPAPLHAGKSEECRRLLASAQNEAEASVLTYLSRSWLMIAGQIDRYVEIVKNRSAQKK
jgi:hypothetical protein